MGESIFPPSIAAKPDEILSMDYLHADLDDIIFRNRNKEYGAYFLRKHYTKYMTLANMLAIVLFVAAIFSPTIIKRLKANGSSDENLFATEVTLSEPPPLDPTATPPPPPPPMVEQPILRKATIAFVAPKVKKDEEVAEETAPPDVEDLKKADISTVTREGSEDGMSEGIIEEEAAPEPPLPKAIEEDKPQKEAAPFKIVEQMPTYAEGEAAMFEFIYANIQYPPIAKDNWIQGTVYATFVVEKDGSISNVKIVRDIGGGCGEEAARVIKLMPNWLPGRQRGRPVRVQFTLPVKFMLK